MKDIISFPLWLYWCNHEELSKTEILVFAMFYTDAATFCSGPGLIYQKFGGTIHYTHIRRAFRKLEKRQFIKRNGIVRKNKRGKGSPEYVINDKWMVIAREELERWNSANKVDNGPETTHFDNGPKDTYLGDNGPDLSHYDTADNGPKPLHFDAEKAVKKALDNGPQHDS